MTKVILTGRWLLFNWGTFWGEFRTRKEAKAEMLSALGPEDFPKWKNYFDLVRGEVRITSAQSIRGTKAMLPAAAK